jgi:hypothetical protein
MGFMKLNGIPEPPEGYVPPLGSSLNTWTNIYKNKGRIDYCVQQFGVSFVSMQLLSLTPHQALPRSPSPRQHAQKRLEGLSTKTGLLLKMVPVTHRTQYQVSGDTWRVGLLLV